MKHTFKRMIALLLAVVMVLGVMPSVFAANVEPFKDVQDNAWYAPYVKAVYEAGLMQGVKANRFDPEGTSTRAQVVTVLYRIAGQPPVGGPATFTDLVADWYANPVAWAQKEGVVNGKSKTEFGPDDNVTREQLVTMIHRYYGEPVGTGDLNAFSDAAKVSDYAKKAFAWAIGAGVINGNKGKLDPLGEATRAQFAKIIWTAKEAMYHDHQWDEGVITREATCGATGLKTYSCTVPNCEEKRVETIPATGAHTWNEGEITNASTCAEAGVKTYTCSVCGKVKTEEIAATGEHNYVNGTCTVCGAQQDALIYTRTETLNEGDQVIIVAAAKNMALSGEYNGFYNAATAVTPNGNEIATFDSTIVWTVGKEGDYYTFSYNGQKIGMADTYSSMPLGEKNYTWQVLPAKTEGAFYLFNVGRQVYAEYYETNSNWSGYYNNANEELFALHFYVRGNDCDHAWNEGEVTTPATCTEAGVKTYTCSVCGATKTETIEATGHNAVDGVCTICGENVGGGEVYNLTSTLNDGDQVVIVAAAKNMALSATYSGFYNSAVAVTPVDGKLTNPAEDLIWTVGKDGDTYTFSYNGQKIGMADTYSSMPLGEKNDTWQVLPAVTEGAFYIFNIGRQVYMEYYETNGNWSGYYNNAKEELFALNFYVKGEAPCDHAWNDGVVTAEPTCTNAGVKTYTCTLCGETKEEAIMATGNHNYVDGVCTECGAVVKSENYYLTSELKDGDQVVIVAAAKNIALSATYSGFYNSAVAVTPVDGILTNPAEDLIWTVGKDGDIYTFSYNGQKLGMADTYSSMPLGEKNDTWQVLPAMTEGAFYIFNIGRQVYVEYYEKNGNWSGYHNNSNEELFALNFYVKGDAPACIHAWNEGEVTKAATCVETGEITYTCAKCGETKVEYTAPTGEHTYDNGACTQCGKTEPKPAVYVLTTELKTGDEVIIFNPGNGKALSTIKNVYYLDGVDMTPVDNKMENSNTDIVWTVRVNEDGTYTFLNGGKELSVDSSVSNNKTYINIYAENGHKANWNLETCNVDTNTFYVTNLEIEAKFEKIYLEWYGAKNGFSAYDTSADKATELDFGFQFFAKDAVEACQHVWNDGEITTQPTCSKVGVKTYTCTLCGATKLESIPTSDVHNFENGVCTDCGKTEDVIYPAGYVAIYNVAHGVVMTTESSVYNNKEQFGAAAATLAEDKLTTEANNVALFKMVAENGMVTFVTPEGKFLEADGTNIRLVDVEGENTLFVLEETEGGYYVRLANAVAFNKAQYIEYYTSANVFTVYGMGKDTTMYVFNFYEMGETVEPTETTEPETTEPETTEPETTEPETTEPTTAPTEPSEPEVPGEATVVEFADLQDGDKIAIVVTAASDMTGKDYVLLNNFGATAAANAAVFDGTFTETMYWTVKIVDGVVYLVNGDIGLSLLDNNNGLRANGEAMAITMDESGYLSMVDPNGNVRYIGVYDNNGGDVSKVATPNFRTYKNTTGNTKNQTTTIYKIG